MPFRKFAAKAYRGAKKSVKKRYGLNKKSKGVKFGNMASDVMMLKKMINAEKKAFAATFPLAAMGQSFGATLGGALIYDITPLLDQGVGASQRTGNSVKLTSALYQFQITHQSAAVIANKVIIEFWQNKGSTQDTATLFINTFDPSTFSTIVDANSFRDQNHFSDYRLMRRIVKTVPADTVTSSDPSTITFDVPFKFNRGKGHHIRLGTISNNPVNDILNGQIYMTLRCANGNSSTTTATTLSLPVTAINTGLNLRFAYKVWYYDN